VRHIAAVRRRLAAGAPGAARVGRRFLLTIDAVVDEVFGSRVRSMRRVARAVARLGRAANDNGGRA
jgi:hypothetical protein